MAMRLFFRKLVEKAGLYRAFAVIAAVAILVSPVWSWALSVMQLEAEAGTISGDASVIDDGSASGGKALRIGSGGSNGTVTLPNPGTWTNVTSNLAGMSSECGDLSNIFSVPNSSSIIAGVALRGLWMSTDNGATWTQLGTGSGSAQITNRPSTVSFDPANPSIFYEAGIYNGGGVYKTTNGGQTFTQLGSISHIDHVSIDYSDPNRQTLLATGHEASQKVYKSTNGGSSWTEIGQNLPSGTGFSNQSVIINAQTFLVGVNNAAGSGGIYRTTNGGSSWTKVSSASVINEALVASNGTIYFNVGTYNGDHLAKSTDNGVTWTEVGNGSVGMRPVELQDGRLVSYINGRMVVSADGGSTWATFGAALPYSPSNSLIYAPGSQSFYISHFDCNFNGDRVPSDAVMRLK
jgi:photosystem II stability/assembly factor-like uncharacterized protein